MVPIEVYSRDRGGETNDMVTASVAGALLRRGALLAILVLVGPRPDPLAAQPGLPLFFETGLINFGPVVTKESVNFVRFGSNGGMERYFAATLTDDRWYLRLTIAPTQVHVWSVQDTFHTHVRRPSDPRRSRWQYRPVGAAPDDFLWSTLSGGVQGKWGPFSGRAGAGLISLSQTDHGFWGGTVGHVSMVEAAGAVRWRGLGVSCGGMLGFLGRLGARWIVLEHVAGNAPPSGARSPRTLKPVHCGFEIRIGGRRSPTEPPPPPVFDDAGTAQISMLIPRRVDPLCSKVRALFEVEKPGGIPRPALGSVC
jgi:hypothetical protein